MTTNMIIILILASLFFGSVLGGVKGVFVGLDTAANALCIEQGYAGGVWDSVEDTAYCFVEYKGE